MNKLMNEEMNNMGLVKMPVVKIALIKQLWNTQKTKHLY